MDDGNGIYLVLFTVTTVLVLFLAWRHRLRIFGVKPFDVSDLRESPAAPQDDPATAAMIMSYERWRKVQQRQMAGVRRAKTRLHTSMQVPIPPSIPPSIPLEATEPRDITNGPFSPREQQLVAMLVERGVSGNKIIDRIGGDRNVMLKEIAAVREKITMPKTGTAAPGTPVVQFAPQPGVAVPPAPAVPA